MTDETPAAPDPWAGPTSYTPPRFPSVHRLGFRLAALVLVAVLPVFVLGVAASLRARGDAIRAAGAEAGRLARIASRNQEEAFRGAARLLEAIAAAPALRQGSPAEKEAWLKDLLEKNPGFADFHIARPDGSLVAGALGAGASKDLCDLPNVERAVKTRQSSVGNFESGLSGRPTVHVARPLLDAAGAPEAVLAAVLNLGWLEQFQSALQLPAGSVLEVVDPAGVLLLRLPDAGSDGIGKAHPAMEAQREILPGDDRPLVAADADGARRFYGIAPLSTGGTKKGFTILVGFPEDSVTAPADRALAIGLVVSTIVLVASLLLSQYMAERFVLRRVGGLILATRRLANTDLDRLDARSRVCQDPSELGDLERSFDVMVHALEDRARELNRRAKELEERSKGR